MALRRLASGLLIKPRLPDSSSKKNPFFYFPPPAADGRQMQTRYKPLNPLGNQPGVNTINLDVIRKSSGTIKIMKLFFLQLLILASLAVTMGGCHSSIVPLKPAAIGPPWALSPAAPTAAAARPARPETIPSAASQTSAPRNNHARSHWFVNYPNGTTRYIAIERYGNIWRQVKHLLIHMGYTIQWSSYRLGVITTRYRTGPEILQWWRPDSTTFPELMEGTINTFRRTVRVVISRTDKPHTFAITVEALVERQENPQGSVGNVAFFGASAFGNNPLSLQSHRAGPSAGGPYWMRVGHDPALEEKILHRLFKKL
jgi:hypothetical protein